MRSTKLGWLCVATLVACGGSTAVVEGDGDSGGGGGGDSGVTPDGGIGGDSGPSGDGGGNADSGQDGGGAPDSGQDSGGSSPVCPPNVPNGGTCSPVGLECEYGTNTNPACNTVVDCTQNGWQREDEGMCPVGGMCPATYAMVPHGQSCSPNGLECSYALGQCDCTNDSIVVHQTPVWVCTPTTSGCPQPRPPLGSACTDDGLSCDYGACSGGLQEQCEGGYWRQENTACPSGDVR